MLTTGSGAEALTMLETQPVDLIMLDLNLPDVSGESVAAEVRSRSAVPILMLTAKSTGSGPDPRVGARCRRLPHETVLTEGAGLAGAGGAPRRSRTSIMLDAHASFGAGTLMIDEVRHDVTVRGRSVELDTNRVVARRADRRPGRVLPSGADQSAAGV